MKLGPLQESALLWWRDRPTFNVNRSSSEWLAHQAPVPAAQCSCDRRDRCGQGSGAFSPARRCHRGPLAARRTATACGRTVCRGGAQPSDQHWLALGPEAPEATIRASPFRNEQTSARVWWAIKFVRCGGSRSNRSLLQAPVFHRGLGPPLSAVGGNRSPQRGLHMRSVSLITQNAVGWKPPSQLL
jgi:hypothetical protein